MKTLDWDKIKTVEDTVAVMKLLVKAMSNENVKHLKASEKAIEETGCKHLTKQTNDEGK